MNQMDATLDPSDQPCEVNSRRLWKNLEVGEDLIVNLHKEEEEALLRTIMRVFAQENEFAAKAGEWCPESWAMCQCGLTEGEIYIAENNRRLICFCRLLRRNKNKPALEFRANRPHCRCVVLWQ